MTSEKQKPPLVQVKTSNITATSTPMPKRIPSVQNVKSTVKKPSVNNENSKQSSTSNSNRNSAIVATIVMTNSENSIKSSELKKSTNSDSISNLTNSTSSTGLSKQSVVRKLPTSSSATQKISTNKKLKTTQSNEPLASQQQTNKLGILISFCFYLYFLCAFNLQQLFLLN